MHNTSGLRFLFSNLTSKATLMRTSAACVTRTFRVSNLAFKHSNNNNNKFDLQTSFRFEVLLSNISRLKIYLQTFRITKLPFDHFEVQVELSKISSQRLLSSQRFKRYRSFWATGILLLAILCARFCLQERLVAFSSMCSGADFLLVCLGHRKRFMQLLL